MAWEADPATGFRRRLGKSAAELGHTDHLFKQATKSLDPAGTGYTLRQLKPRA
jgi:hypothetical protein